MTARKLHRIIFLRIALGACSLIVSLGSLIGYAIDYRPLYAPIDRILGNMIPISSMAPTTALAIMMLSIATILGAIGRVESVSRSNGADKE
jgi:hypothetical protein